MNEYIIKTILSFGAGVVATSIGGVQAFVFCGIVGLIAGISNNTIVLNNGAFGALFSPNVGFAAACAATAFAASKKMKLLSSGTSIITELGKYKNPWVLILGGVFGSLGYIINLEFQSFNVKCDTVALTVFVLGVITRLVFGETGLFGKKQGQDKRKYFMNMKTFIFYLILNAGISMIVGYIVMLTNDVTFGFCISAITLLFCIFGHEIPVTHHVTMVAGYAAIASHSILIVAIFGILAGVVHELLEKVFNSYNDTHIDPPAGAIACCSALIFMIY